MSKISKQQFLAFAEAVYLTKIQGEPISEEFEGWVFGISDTDPSRWGENQFRIEVMNPNNFTLVEEPVRPDEVLSMAESMFDRVFIEESRSKGEPLKYEHLPEHLKENLALGHVLAEHTITIPDTGLTDTHLTTVQLSLAYDERDRSVHFCNDVCGDFTEFGSVEVLMVEMPQALAADEEQETEVKGLVVLPPLPPLRVLREAHMRLELLKAWLYEQYRMVHASNGEVARTLELSLFMLCTGKRFGDDPDLLGRFVEFLHDSVVVYDAEEMPGWEQDCGA